jgi:hypothetical protein
MFCSLGEVKIRGQGPGLVTSLVFFPCFIMQKNPFFSKIHSFSKPVPLPPVRKWQTDLPETRKSLYLKQKNSLILSLVYACIGSVAEASSTKNDGGNPWRTSRLMPRGVLVVAYSCCRRINTTTSLVVLFHLPRAERFVRHALLAEPTFLDLRRGCSFYPSLGNSEEMVNSTLPCPIGIDSPLCLLSQHTWRRIVPTMFAGAQSA